MRVVTLWPIRVMDDVSGLCTNAGGRHMSLCAALVLMWAEASWAQVAGRERISFNEGWRFAKGDPTGAAGKLSYNEIRNWVLATGVAFTKDPNFANKKRVDMGVTPAHLIPLKKYHCGPLYPRFRGRKRG